MVQVPQSVEIPAGSYGLLSLTLKNEGHQRGEALLKLSAFDSLYEERELALEPGEEREIEDIYLEAAADLAGGSYPCYYTLQGSGLKRGASSGHFNFTVQGVVLTVDASRIGGRVSVVPDRQVYAPGEVVQASSSAILSTTESGTHHLVYGLYRSSLDNQPVVSGRLCFDVGDAVLLGMTTDRFDYPGGSEDVEVQVHYFGAGDALLELYLDEEMVQTRTLTLQGAGQGKIVLTSGTLSGGSHHLRAVLKQAGLFSQKEAAFIYGSRLPDLVTTLSEMNRDGLSYHYRVTVTNRGKTTANASTLVFTDNNTDAETTPISSLQPAGSFTYTFHWNGSGKAGAHEFTFEVDRENAIKEFCETNNRMTHQEEVPPVFFKAKSISPAPRVLVMSPTGIGSHADQAAWLVQLMAQQQIEHVRASGLTDSYLKFQGGETHINVVFGNLVSRHFREERKKP